MSWSVSNSLPDRACSGRAPAPPERRRLTSRSTRLRERQRLGLDLAFGVEVADGVAEGVEAGVQVQPQLAGRARAVEAEAVAGEADAGGGGDGGAAGKLAPALLGPGEG